MTETDLAERMRQALEGTFPANTGVEVMAVQPGEARGRITIRPRHLHPGGFVHSAVIACLADSVAAWATVALLGPDQGFSTIEFKTNFFMAIGAGVLVAEARALHHGRRTIVLESQVVDQEGKLVALMVVTQAVLDVRRDMNPRADG